MIQTPNAPSASPDPVRSERFRMATVARAAALAIPGVAGTDTGSMGLFVTVDRGERVEGVRCMATDGVGYEVALRLVCAMVSLPRLSEQVKAAVTSAADTAGIELDSVSVHISDLVETEEL